jgi:hypothetical protein
MRGMVEMRRAGWVVAVLVAVGIGVAGCGSGGGGGGDDSKAGGTSSAAAPSATSTPMSVEDAYREYQGTMGGCTTVEECQELMTARLAAVHDMAAAMRAEDSGRYAEPIQDAARAERLAKQYGTTNLGAAGNMAAVMQPVQAVVSWYAANR